MGSCKASWVPGVGHKMMSDTTWCWTPYGVGHKLVSDTKWCRTIASDKEFKVRMSVSFAKRIRSHPAMRMRIYRKQCVCIYKQQTPPTFSRFCFQLHVWRCSCRNFLLTNEMPSHSGFSNDWLTSRSRSIVEKPFRGDFSSRQSWFHFPSFSFFSQIYFVTLMFSSTLD